MKCKMISDGKGGKKVASPTKTQSAAIFKEATATLSAFGIIKEADSVVVQRESFENEELARSNKALYAILTRIYALFNKAVEEKCIKDTVKLMKEQLKKRNVKVQINTPALTVFVRYVFNSDRKRAYNYTSTLMAAIDKQIAPEMLADFIEGNNGVEECKKAYKMKDETKQRIDSIAAASTDVLDVLSTMQAAAKVTMSNARVDFSDGAEFAFIVARTLGNGDFELLRVVPKTTKAIQNAAVKELAKDLLTQAAKSAVDAKYKKAKTSTENAAKGLTVKAAAKMTVKELEAA